MAKRVNRNYKELRNEDEKFENEDYIPEEFEEDFDEPIPFPEVEEAPVPLWKKILKGVGIGVGAAAAIGGAFFGGKMLGFNQGYEAGVAGIPEINDPDDPADSVSPSEDN